MAIRNIKLIIQYDGINYSGWQCQPGRPTVQSELERAFSELAGAPIKVNGASRTDAGVSAIGQVANIIIDSPIPTENFLKGINHRLPRDISVTDAVEVDMDFESSTAAKSKLYQYKIFIGKERNVLEIRNSWHRPGDLDVNAMDKAAKELIGTYDFKSFAAAADTRDNSIRTVMQCNVKQQEKWIYIEIEANRFLYNMVRNIVGTFVEVGRGRWKPERIKEIIEAKNRTAAGPTAPPEGLCLMWIKY